MDTVDTVDTFDTVDAFSKSIYAASIPVENCHENTI